MQIGIGTYALFWESHAESPRPLGLAASIDRAAELGCDVFQICDDPRIEQVDAPGLDALRDRAELLGVALELGTRTIGRDHLARYLDLAERLGARTLRSMLQTPEMAGDVDGAVAELAATLPRLRETGTTLALETYEQLPTADLLAVVRGVDDPHVGICLDPVNTVSALEHPRDVIDACAPYTVNLHVKDARFTRAEGWVGFSYTGAPLGEGLLDLEHELDAVYRDGRSPSAIVEHWLPREDDLAATVAAERAWTDRTLAALRARRDAQAA